MMTKTENHQYLPFLVLAIVMALAAYFMTLNFQGMFVWDEAEYALSARSMLEGESYLNKLRPPMMGFLGFISMLVTGVESDFILTSSIAILAVLGGIGLYNLLGQLNFHFAGIMAAISLLFMPYYWLQSTMFLSEIPFILFFQCAILYFYKGLYHKGSAFHYSWIFVGLAFLTRYTSLVLGPIFVLMLLVKLINSKTEFLSLLKKKDFWISPLWMLIILSPWLIHQQITHGNFLVGFEIASKQLSVYMPDTTMPWHYYLSNMDSLLGYPSMTFVLAGIVLVIFKKNMLGIHCIVILVFLIIYFSIFRYKEIRLITCIMPVCAILVGLFCHILQENYFKSLKHPLLILSFLLLLAYFGFAHNYNRFKYFRALGYPSLIDAMTYLKSVSSEDEIIMGASTPQIAWYCDRPTVGFPPDYKTFKTKLKDTNWILIVNYERGQVNYLLEEIKPTIYRELLQSGDAQIFQSQNGFFTIVAGSRALSEIINLNSNQ